MSLLRITPLWIEIGCFFWENDVYLSLFPRPYCLILLNSTVAKNSLVQCWHSHMWNWSCGILQCYCSSTCNLEAVVSESSGEAASGKVLTSSKSEDVGIKSIRFPFKSEETAASSAASSNGKMMLIDGTSIIYRAYYKLLGMYATHVYSECKIFPQVSHLLTFDWEKCSKVESWSSDSRWWKRGLGFNNFFSSFSCEWNLSD